MKRHKEAAHGFILLTHQMVLKSQVLLLWMDAKILAIREHNVVEGSQHNKKQNLSGPTRQVGGIRGFTDMPLDGTLEQKSQSRHQFHFPKQQLPRNDGSNVLFSRSNQNRKPQPVILKLNKAYEATGDCLKLNLGHLPVHVLSPH